MSMIYEKLINKSFFSTVKLGIVRTLSANVINKIIGMISAMIITRMLTTIDYGIWSYTLNIYGYFTLISGLGLISGNIQFGTENKGEGKAYSFYKYCLFTGILIDVVVVTISILVFSNISFPIEGAKKYIILYQPMLLIEYVIAIMQGVFRSKNKIKEYAQFLNINSVGIALGTCTGALFGVGGAIIGRYIAGFVTLVYAYFQMRKMGAEILRATPLNKTDVSNLWKYSIFVGISSALNLLVYGLDVSMVAALIQSAEDVAIYKVGTLIPNALEFIPSGVLVAILPTIIYHKDDIEWIRINLKKTFLYLLVFNALLTVGVLASAPIIIRIISGEDYLPAVPIFRILMISYFFSASFSGIGVNMLAAFRRVKFGLFISVATCILDVIFNYMLINRYGIVGAAYATLLANVLSGAMSSIYVYILLKNGKLNKQVLNT